MEERILFRSSYISNCVFSGVLFITATLPIVAESNTDIKLSELLQLSLAELQTIQVYTASRDLTSIEEAPSVMTVITAEQIKRQGLKTLTEVLERVPGFFMDYSSHVLPSYIYHRGALTGNSSGVLFLLDGVPQNFQYAYGIDAQHIFPNLSYVKRIEVVRGSSSTLWGSDASTGVINIITYDGSDLDDFAREYGTFRVSYDHQFQNERQITHLNWGKQFSEGDAMFTVTYSESDSDLMGSGNSSSYRFVGWDTIRPSHDIYFKGTYQDLTFLARHARFANAGTQFYMPEEFSSSVDNNVVGDRRMETEAVGLTYNRMINDRFNLDTSVHYIGQSVGRYLMEPFFDVTTYREDEFSEKKYLADVILHHQSNHWKNKIGLHWNLIDFGGRALNNSEKLPGIEHDHAVFAETVYQGTSNLSLTTGIRIEKDDLRGRNTEIMPRFSAVYRIFPDWSLRYAYSTGIVRPQRVYNVGNGWILWRVDENGTKYYAAGTYTSQKTTTNEIQLTYHTDSFNVATTLFHAKAKNSFTWLGQTPLNPPDDTNDYGYWYGNIDQIRSQGVELEFAYLPKDYLRFYGNMTYQHSEYRSPYVTSLDGIDKFELFEAGQRSLRVPDTMWNMGLDYDLTSQLSLNIHYRGFKGVTLSDGYKEGSINYLDMNLTYDDVLDMNLDITGYAKNIFNNLDHRGHVGFAEPGREVGVTLSLEF